MREYNSKKWKLPVSLMFFYQIFWRCIIYLSRGLQKQCVRLVHILKWTSFCSVGKKYKSKAKSRNFSKFQGENFVWMGSELSLISGNYHGHLGPCGVNLASAEAKIRHVFCFKKMAAKLLKFAEQVLQEF